MADPNNSDHYNEWLKDLEVLEKERDEYNQLMLNADDQINPDDPYRTAFHFQPPRNWINDPNGPFSYKGIYHLFYQYYPYTPKWRMGGIVWGHSTSTDLINWKQQPIALSPSEHYDIRGIWSGSTTILPGNKPAIFYTGGNLEFNQLQNLAFPKDLCDPYLKEWVKAPQNPVIDPLQYNTIDPKELRDPATAWLLPDGKWRTVIGTKQGRTGSAALFTSKDFITWNKVDHPLHSVQDVGMWECLDFFPVYVGQSIGADTSVIGDEVKHVLKISLFDGHKELYTIGRYDIVNDVYIPDEGSIENLSGLMCDYGKYYASKSFFDSKTNRRILFRWVSESSTPEDDNIKGWSGLLGIPRTIVLDEFGKQLVQWPVTEVEKLRHGQVDFPSLVIKGRSVVEICGITSSQADVEVSFEIPAINDADELDSSWTDPHELPKKKGISQGGRVGPFGLLTLASTGLEEYTAVFFRVFKDPNSPDKYVVFMGNDLSSSSLNSTTEKPSYGAFVDVDPTKDELSLRVLIDHSIVESFGAKGKNCMTARVYPTLAINDKAKLYLFNYGSEDVKITKLSAWSMNKAQVNLPIPPQSYVNCCTIT